jgi:acyl-CoA synthetase (AMP-forming)/AMP-acid ligase II
MNLDQPIGPSDVNLNSGPLTHAAGLMMMIYYSRGATNIILPRFDEREVLETIQRERVSSLLLIPTMLYRILLTPDLKAYDLSSIRRIWYGTAPMALGKLKEAIRVFGNVFRQNYGMSEMAQPITYLGPEDHVLDGGESQTRRLSSAGRPAMGVEVRVVDEDGQPVKPGEIGEILVRSNKLMQGYWKKPEETAEAFRGGWFHTRDMAMMDEDGYVYILDRKSDMIISGGFNIYPREVEDIIMAHPGVAEAAVISVPHEIWGEAVKAMVVLKEGVKVSETEIIEHCRRNLASYKKPTSVDFIKEIPKNLNGKVNRRMLREPFWKGYDRWVH